MAFAEILATIGGVLSPITELVDSVTTTKEEKLELKAKLLEIKNSLTEKYIDLESKAIDASKAVMVAELQQTDKFTKRARPTIVYAGLVILFLNHVLLPWTAWFGINIFDKLIDIPTINLPAEFWIAWGGVCGVYAWSRGKEKVAGMK